MSIGEAAAQAIATTTLKAALERITRKAWPFEHKRTREFFRKDGKPFRVVRCQTEEMKDPLWIPDWASYENNPCDCPKCIAIRALADFKETLQAA